MVEFAGTFSPDRMKTVGREIMRRKKARRDFLVDRSKMGLVDTGGENGICLRMEMPDGNVELMPFRRGSLHQLATTLHVPIKFVDRLVEDIVVVKGEDPINHRDVATHVFNKLLEREPKRHLVRTLDDQVDAVLSDSYRCLDNADLLAIVLDELSKVGAEVWDMRVSRDEFHLHAWAPHISGEVRLDRPFDPGDGWMSRWKGKDGDVQNAGLVVRNSETGRGGLNVKPSLLTRVCANFCVWSTGVAQIHLGKKKNDDGEVFFSDETKQAEDGVIWMKVRDTVKATFDPETFQKKIDQLNRATQVKVEKPTEVVSIVVKELGIPEEYKEAILENFLRNGDESLYGLGQAVTQPANPSHKETPDDDRTLLEHAGGQLFQMSEKKFLSLVG